MLQKMKILHMLQSLHMYLACNVESISRDIDSNYNIAICFIYRQFDPCLLDGGWGQGGGRATSWMGVGGRAGARLTSWMGPRGRAGARLTSWMGPRLRLQPSRPMRRRRRRRRHLRLLTRGKRRQRRQRGWQTSWLQRRLQRGLRRP